MASNVVRSTSVVGGMTLISRILGFVRDMVFARMFGASPAMDAFLVAFRIPNFLRRVFAEGAFSQAFVPVLAETRELHGDEATRRLVGESAATLGGVLLVVSALGMLAAPMFVSVFGAGFIGKPGGEFSMATDMLRVTFPYIFFIALTSLAGGVLNTYGRFAVPAITPVFLNLSFLGFAIFASPYFDEPVYSLAWAVCLAGVIQLLFQMPFLLKLNLLGRLRWGWSSPGVTKIRTLMIPAIVGSSVSQISLLLGSIIGSMLPAGSVSWLYYADRLMEFPLGIFAIALGTVILPNLSGKWAAGDTVGFNAGLDQGLRLSLLVIVPAAVGLGVFSGPLITTLFQYGQFTPDDVEMARIALIAYSVGLFGFALVKVLVPGFYARQDTRTPMLIGLRSLAIGMLLMVGLVLSLQYVGFSAPHLGLAIATATTATLNSAWLYLRLRRDNVYTPIQGWSGLWLRVIGAVVLMGAFLIWFHGSLDSWFEMDAWQRGSQLGLGVAGGIAVYILSLLIFGLRPRHLR
ncbi:MAG: putative peptidoglycan lipid II flippase [Gammaproteobacteria bacterium]|jgi:putative peptidoglycan lipid II flippase